MIVLKWIEKFFTSVNDLILINGLIMITCLILVNCLISIGIYSSCLENIHWC